MSLIETTSAKTKLTGMTVALYEIHPGSQEPAYSLRCLCLAGGERDLLNFWATRRVLFPYIVDVLVVRSGWVLRNAMTDQRFSSIKPEAAYAR